MRYAVMKKDRQVRMENLLEQLVNGQVLTATGTPAPSQSRLIPKVASWTALMEFNQTSSDTEYRNQVTACFANFDANNVLAYVERGFQTLFTDNITEKMTLYNRQGGKKDAYTIARGSPAVDRKNFEEAFKTTFWKAYDRNLKRVLIEATIAESEPEPGPSSEISHTPEQLRRIIFRLIFILFPVS